MHGIAMAKTSTVSERSVMIECGSPHNDFVKTVAIQVANGKVVVTFAIKSLPLLVGTVQPAGL